MAADLTPYQQYRAMRQATVTAKTAPNRRFDPDVAKARAAERSRRAVETRRRATQVLVNRHPNEYAEIAAIEAQGVANERGPLPGDPDWKGGDEE